MGGSRRKRWRKRQRESRSEWHMAFSLKKDEQHKTTSRICINQRKGGGSGRAGEEDVGLVRAENGADAHARS